YLLGAELHTIDVIAYAFLANIVRWAKPSPLTDVARGLPNLEAYLKRIDAQLAANAPAATVDASSADAASADA
ncbi:MAG: Glutathione S-transferase, C-terminal domain, partial [Myxococcaceae bacterium]|nr:Glutathione S-transferase, C-terminal domain [Myxococcaceae bacterium]